VIPQRVPNPFSEPVDESMVCAIANRWGLEPVLVDRLIEARNILPFDISIFSGRRELEHQRNVSGTAFDRSTHASHDAGGCERLATGADVQPTSPGNRVTRAPNPEAALFLPVAQFGAAVMRSGLRWGGGAALNPRTGFPEGNEVWHVDLGPR